MTANNTSNQPPITPRQSLMRHIFRAIQAGPRWDKIEFKIPIRFHRAEPDPSQLFLSVLPLSFNFCSPVGNRTLHIGRCDQNGGFWSAKLVSSRIGPETFNVAATIFLNPSAWERRQRDHAGEALEVEDAFRGEQNLLPFGAPEGPYRDALELSLVDAIARLSHLLTGRRPPVGIEHLHQEFVANSFGYDAGVFFNFQGWRLRHWETYVDLPIANAASVSRRSWERAVEQFSRVSGRTYEITPPQSDDALRATRHREQLTFSTNIETTYNRQIAIYAKTPERLRYEVRWNKRPTSGAMSVDGTALAEFQRRGMPGLVALLSQHSQQALRDFERTAASLIADDENGAPEPLLIEELRERVFGSRYSDATKVDAFRQLLQSGSYLPTGERESHRMENYLRRHGICLPPVAPMQPRQVAPRYRSILRRTRE